MKIVCSLVMLFFSLIAQAADDTMTMTIPEQQKQFQITLPANPTTGFQWTIKEFDRQLLRLKKSEYNAPVAKRMGAGGKMVFTFEKIKDTHPKQTEIVFQYARSWESKDGTLKRVTIDFSGKKTSP